MTPPLTEIERIYVNALIESVSALEGAVRALAQATGHSDLIEAVFAEAEVRAEGG